MSNRNASRGFGPRIGIEDASCFDRVPAVPVYRPSELEFRDFATCMSFIERFGAQHMGLCKIIPPRSWRPRRSGYNEIDVMIEKPILQICAGTSGIFLQDVRAQKSMSFKKFEKMSNSVKLKTPHHENIDALEDIYWSTIEHIQPLYGANVSGSLTDPEEVICNIPKLQSTLSDILGQEDIEIGGVNTPYLYFGAWATTFAWHVEDMDLYSINYLHFGAPKLWYCIPPAFARKFEAFAREHFKPEFLACHSFLRHKSILIHPKILAAAGIPTRRILQKEGEIMCTFPYGYHAGFNLGLNCAESTNFALPRWVEYGKKASVCRCWDDTVRIDMAPFVRRIQPNLFDKWQRGVDVAAHPLDVYKSRQEKPICGSQSYSRSHTQSPAGDLPIVDIQTPVADLNVRGLFYTQAVLDKATLPRFLRRNSSLKPLWTGFELDFRAISYFNRLIGRQDPFCSICAFFWPPMVVRKSLSGFQTGEEVPPRSEPYLSEVVFCRSPRDFAKIPIVQDPTSPILTCSQCQLVVHARCYGCEDESAPGNDAGQSSSWMCDPCSAGTLDPRCVLCPLRGGAFKSLENHHHTPSSTKFWVHLACAIAVGASACRFIDIGHRKPLLLLSGSSDANSAHAASDDGSSCTTSSSRRVRRPQRKSAVANLETTPSSSVGQSSLSQRNVTPSRRAGRSPGYGVGTRRSAWRDDDAEEEEEEEEAAEIVTNQQTLKRCVGRPPCGVIERAPLPQTYDIDDDDEEGGDGAYRCSTEVRRRDGRPAKLARMHGLGQPRLTMYPHSCLESPSGRLGSPRWWSSAFPSPTSPLHYLDEDTSDSVRDHSTVNPDLIHSQTQSMTKIPSDVASSCIGGDVVVVMPSNPSSAEQSNSRLPKISGIIDFKETGAPFAGAENDPGNPAHLLEDAVECATATTDNAAPNAPHGETLPPNGRALMATGDTMKAAHAASKFEGASAVLVDAEAPCRGSATPDQEASRGEERTSQQQAFASKGSKEPSVEARRGAGDIDQGRQGLQADAIEISDDEPEGGGGVSQPGVRPRSKRLSRLPTWAAGDFLLTQPKKSTHHRSFMTTTSSEIPTTAVETVGRSKMHSTCGGGADAVSPQQKQARTTDKVVISSRVPRDHCEECGLASPGGPSLELALVRCWHEDCPGRVHLTCAQFGGYLIATGRYPHCFYIACKRHDAEYRQYDQVEEGAPLEPGDAVYALYPGNGRYYKAVAVELAVPRLCKVAFHDGTFSRDTPLEDIIAQDDRHEGPPKVGSNVRVRWKDGGVYSAVFQGASFDKWIVRFQNGKTIRLRSDKIFRCNERIPTHIRRLIMR